MQNILTPRIRKISLSTVPFAKADWSPLQVNHIYGENGTGKTTLAGLLPSGEGVTWEDGFSSSDVRILCYNRQYVERCVSHFLYGANLAPYSEETKLFARKNLPDPIFVEKV